MMKIHLILLSWGFPNPGDILFVCPPCVAHVEHHVADNQLDKVRQAIKVGIQFEAFFFHMCFPVLIKDLQNSLMRNCGSARICNCIVFGVLRFDSMPNTESPLSRGVHIYFVAVALMDLRWFYNISIYWEARWFTAISYSITLSWSLKWSCKFPPGQMMHKLPLMDSRWHPEIADCIFICSLRHLHFHLF